MDAFFDTNRASCSDCSSCPRDTVSKVICHCLQVSEDTLLEALATFDLATVKDVRHHTGAGDGCTACHRTIRRYIEQHQRRTLELQLVQSSSPSPI